MSNERSLRVVATTMYDILTTLLRSIEEVKEARVRAAAEGQTEAGEYLSLKALGEAEDHLQELILQPEVAEILGQMCETQAEIAGEAA